MTKSAMHAKRVYQRVKDHYRLADYAWDGIVFFVVVALVLLLPDRRIERLISQHPAQ